MKTILAAVVFALAAGAASAQTDPVSVAQFCEVRGKTAEIVMRARQDGVPLSKLMNTNAAQQDQIISLMIQAAYAVPRYQSASFRVRAAEDFRNEVEASCFANRQ